MAELPPWMSSKGNKRRQNRRSSKQESDRAKEIGGRASAGSGSSYRSPQDVRNQEFLEQLKYTDANQYTIKAKEWESLKKDALKEGREPRMVVETPFGRLIITEG